MVRLTKGFIKNFYPDYDYSEDTFHVFCVRPYKENEKETLLSLVRANNLIRDSRGDGVIDFWHRITVEGRGGAWVFCFYQAAFFIVLHIPKGFDQNTNSPASV